MIRSSFFLFFVFGLFSCLAEVAPPAPSSSPSATPAPAASPSRDTLASAAGGYLDAPKKSKYGYSSVNVDGPYIAMTFDDGPQPALTPKLLDLLKKKGVKATFFVVGQNVAEYPDVVKRAASEGHEIANHSWSHPDFARMSDAAVRNELQKTEDAIQQATGAKSKLLRPPYGAITKSQRDWIHNEYGFKIVLWDIDPLDWKYRNSAHVENEILKNTRSGSIVLSHDIHATTVAAMSDTFDKLIEKGFKFVTVSELIAMEKPAPPPAVGEAGASKKKSARQGPAEKESGAPQSSPTPAGSPQ